MKNKPIGEGYKFFAICDATTGYVFDFLPDGRAEKGRTILKYVTDLVDSIPRRDTKKYVVAMDNYFTTPNVMEATRERNVGVVWTARGRTGWPPKELLAIDDERFNSLYLMNDERNFLIGRWVDNNIVKMVSTVHRGMDTECVERERRRPRTTATNKTHVNEVWGPDQPTRLIKIPKMIDDYNHWMGGVDKADQLIAYYRPELRCRRVWMPIFLHCLDIMRVNSYVISKSINKKGNQKDFICEFICALNDRALSDAYNGKSTRGTRTATATVTPPTKRRRTSKQSELPLMRFSGCVAEHVACFATGKQKACIHCAHKRMKSKEDDGTTNMKVSYVKRKCSYCDVYLCKDCFVAYHTRE